MKSQPPVLLFAFANDRRVGGQYLQRLAGEQRGIRRALGRAVEVGRCITLERANATPGDVFDALLGETWSDRIVVFHFAGHAGAGALMLEAENGHPARTYGDSLASLLGRQQALQLVFLNGCATANHATALLGAGVPAVIVTSTLIDDATAADLALRFYQGLAAGRTLKRAFEDAEDEVKARVGRDRRRTYHRSFVPDDPARIPWPWTLHAGGIGDVILVPAPYERRRLYRRCGVVVGLLLLVFAGLLWPMRAPPAVESESPTETHEAPQGITTTPQAQEPLIVEVAGAGSTQPAEGGPPKPANAPSGASRERIVPLTLVLNADRQVDEVWVDGEAVAPDLTNPTSLRLQVTAGDHHFLLVSTDGRRCAFRHRVTEESYVSPSCSWEKQP